MMREQRSMVRTSVVAVLLAVAACGGTGPKPAMPPPARAPLPLPAATPLDSACGGEVEDAAPGNYDRFAFEADGEYGYKDATGAVVIAPGFGFAYEFGAGGLAAAVVRPTTEGGRARFVFIDPSGAELAEAYAFDNGPDYFQEGLARVVGADGKVGFIDRGGAIVIAPQFVDASSFCHGVAMVHDGQQQWTIDRSGAAVSAKQPYVPSDDPCRD